MAINNINIDDIETVTTIARDEKNIRAVSFNLHHLIPVQKLNARRTKG